MRIFQPTISGSLIESGSMTVSGSVTATQGFTGSLFGTSSWATNASTASLFITSSVTSASFASTSSNINVLSQSVIVTGSIVLTGSLNIVGGGFTGSHFGTSSWAQNSLTASYFITSSVTSASYAATASLFITSSVTSASFASTASYVNNALTASYFITSSVTSASYAATASYVNNALTASYFITSSVTSASYAATASSADSFNVRTSATASNLLVSNTITAQTLVVQTITASVEYSSGSNIFGNKQTDTQQFTGSVNITGSLNIVGGGFTGSHFGTSSWAINALTSSYFITGSVTSASYASTSSWALNFITSSVTSASYASTSSWALNFITSSVTSASYASTSSWALNFITSSVTSASYAATASLFITSSVTSASFASTASSVNTLNQQVNISGSLYLNSPNVTMGQFVGNQNGYVEFSVRNSGNGASASGDIAVYADTGTVTNNYIDLGINNSGLDRTYFYAGTDFGDALDAYLYNVGGNLRIGNATSQAPYSQSLYLFANPSATVDIAITGSRIGIQKSGSLNATLDVSGSAIISGSLIATNGITGSLFGTSSWAINALTSSYFITSSVTSASYAATASLFITSSVTSASYANTSSWALNFITSSVTSASYAITSSYSTTTVSASFASSSRDFVISNTLRFADAYMDTAIVPSSIVGSNNLFTIDTGSATSAVFQYTVSDGTNLRTGMFLSGWIGTSVTYTDYSSPPIGDTLGVTFAIAIVSSQLQFNATTTTSGWRLKAMVTLI